jgi:hypothetical protein
MTMVRVIKNPDYQYVYILEVKYWWWPFWIRVRSGSKDEMIEDAQNCVIHKTTKPEVVYQSAVL